MKFGAPMAAHMAKRTQECVYDDEMFLSTILLKHPSAFNRVLHINLDTSDVPIQHLFITAPKYGGLSRTFKDICNTQFCRFFSSSECKNEEWPTGCGVNFRLYQNMSNFMINYESIPVRPRFRLNPQPNPSTLYSYNPIVGSFVIK